MIYYIRMMKQPIIKRFCYLSFVALLLNIGSCCGIPYPVDFINETNEPVILTYCTKNLDINDKLYYDTVSYEIGVDSGLYLLFKATYNNSVKKLSRCIPYFKFETPTKSVRFEGPEEVIKIFEKNGEFIDTYKFIISDSLFNCK